MAVVKELIRTEENGTISFGDYEKNQKCENEIEIKIETKLDLNPKTGI